jgi:hypothetical protein
MNGASSAQLLMPNQRTKSNRIIGIAQIAVLQRMGLSAAS